MPVSAHAPARALPPRPRAALFTVLSAWRIEIGALAAVALPVLVLTWRQGGVDRFDQAAVFGWVLTVCGAACLGSRKWGVTVPWVVAVIALVPLLQVVPLGDLHPYLASAFRRETTAAAESLGVAAPTTLSIAPGKTIATLLPVAGCCALFVMARGLATRSERAFWLITACFLTLAMVSAAWGVEQFLRERLVEGGAALGARGSFINKNHYAAFMEAGLGLAIGAALAGLARRHGQPADSGRSRLYGLAGLVAAMVCFSAGMLSFSRAATVILVVTAAAGVALALRENRRLALAALPALAAALAFSATLGGGALGARFNDLSPAAGLPTRAAIWADTLRSAGDYWLTGAGAGTFPYAFRRSAFYLPRKTVDHAHSDYLEWLLEFGLLPTLLLTLALGLTLWRVGLFVFSREDARRRMAAGGAVLGAGAILLHATVDFPLQIPALAALTAVLLGCAAGIARPRSAGPALPPRAAAVGCWALCAAGLLSAAGVLPHDNTETLFGQGRQALLEGRSVVAEKAFIAAAESHPQAAAIWLKRAEAASLAGRPEQAVASAELAARLEPFTLRTQWTLAEAYLRAGEIEAAAGHLAGLAAALPKMRRAGYHAASAGGVRAEKIASEVVPAEPQAAADYLVYLADRRQWPELSAAASVLVGRVELSHQDLRPVYDRLWDADRGVAAKRLWEQIQGAGVGVARSHLEVPNRVDSSPGWMSRPREGVFVTVRNAGLPDERVEVRFKQAPDVDYRHLTRDFFVEPETDYLLKAQVRAESLLAADGACLVLAARRRFIASSFRVRGTTTWKPVTIRFRTRPSEHVVRLAVVNDATGRPHEQLRGRFDVRSVSLHPAPVATGSLAGSGRW